MFSIINSKPTLIGDFSSHSYIIHNPNNRLPSFYLGYIIGIFLFVYYDNVVLRVLHDSTRN